MNKRVLVSLFAVASIVIIGTGFGIAYAAYNTPSETLTINTTNHDIEIPSFAHSFGKNSGDGTAANKAFLIENSIHLRNLSKLQNAGYFDNNTYYFKMDSSFLWDGEETMAPIGNTAHPFTGTFDGNGMTISRVSVTGTVQYSGLFGCIDGGTVKNLILSGPMITITQANSTANYIGFIAGYLKTGTLDKCFVYGGSESFIYSAVLSGTGTYSTSCADYFVGLKGNGVTETGLSFLATVSETTYHSSSSTWDTYTQCPSSASGVISSAIAAFSYSYYKANATDTTVTLRTS